VAATSVLRTFDVDGAVVVQLPRWLGCSTLPASSLGPHGLVLPEPLPWHRSSWLSIELSGMYRTLLARFMLLRGCATFGRPRGIF
jgi:hypothetical protein